MIGQAFIDWVRDLLVTWLRGIGGLLDGIDAAGAGAAIGGVAADAGHFIALFVAPGVWGVVATAWASWLIIWAVTGLFAIIGRRFGGGGSSS